MDSDGGRRGHGDTKRSQQHPLDLKDERGMHASGEPDGHRRQRELRNEQRSSCKDPVCRGRGACQPQQHRGEIRRAERDGVDPPTAVKMNQQRKIGQNKEQADQAQFADRSGRLSGRQAAEGHAQRRQQASDPPRKIDRALGQPAVPRNRNELEYDRETQDGRELKHEVGPCPPGDWCAQSPQDQRQLCTGQCQQDHGDAQTPAGIDCGNDAAGESDVAEEHGLETQENPSIADKDGFADQHQANGDQQQFVDVENSEQAEELVRIPGRGVQGNVEQMAAKEHRQPAEDEAGVVVDDPGEPGPKTVGCFARHGCLLVWPEAWRARRDQSGQRFINCAAKYDEWYDCSLPVEASLP